MRTDAPAIVSRTCVSLAVRDDFEQKVVEHNNNSSEQQRKSFEHMGDLWGISHRHVCVP